MKKYIVMFGISALVVCGQVAHADTVEKEATLYVSDASNTLALAQAEVMTLMQAAVEPFVEKVVESGGITLREKAPGMLVVSWNDAASTVAGKVVFDTLSHPEASTSTSAYPFESRELAFASTTHTVAVGGLSTGMTYFMRAVSDAGRSSAEISYMVGYPPAPCEYLLKALGKGKANSTEDVLKLQNFLRYHERLEVDTNGVYDDVTVAAVTFYQERYKAEILDPWKLEKGTGFVYITTLNKINSAYCNTPIVLTDTEKKIITSGSGMTSVSNPVRPSTGGGTITNPTEPSITLMPTPSIFGGNDGEIHVSTTPKRGRISTFFRRLFGIGEKATTTEAIDTTELDSL
jgi:hypothetical protein